MMKFLAVATLAAGTFLSFAPTEAEAGAFHCRAQSPSAYGTGWHTHSPRYARDRALYECAARTPRHQVCRIVSCNF